MSTKIIDSNALEGSDSWRTKFEFNKTRSKFKEERWKFYRKIYKSYQISEIYKNSLFIRDKK